MNCVSRFPKTSNASLLFKNVPFLSISELSVRVEPLNFVENTISLSSPELMGGQIL
jgi:hypothetical protein